MAQLIRAVKQVLANLLQCRVACENSFNLLAFGHLGPHVIADDRLRHFKGEFTEFTEACKNVKLSPAVDNWPVYAASGASCGLQRASIIPASAQPTNW